MEACRYTRKGAASPRAALNTGLAVQRLDFFSQKSQFQMLGHTNLVNYQVGSLLSVRIHHSVKF